MPPKPGFREVANGLRRRRFLPSHERLVFERRGLRWPLLRSPLFYAGWSAKAQSRLQAFRFFAHGAFVLEPWTNAIKGKKLPAPFSNLWICS
jgi:hypothetical protein